MKPIYIAALIVTIAACTKNKDVAPAPGDVPPAATTGYKERLADSLFKYAKQIYYWNTALPDSATFKPLSYVTDDTISGLQKELLAITRYAVNPATGLPYEQAYGYNAAGVMVQDNSRSKYSFLQKTSDLYNGGQISYTRNAAGNDAAKMTLDGKENELGFGIGFLPVNYLYTMKDTLPYTKGDSIIGMVRYVTPGSPAYNAGLRRGHIIAKYNGNSWSYTSGYGNITAAMDAPSLTLTIKRPANKTNPDTTLSIVKATYTYNPVYNDTVITSGTHKIGYIAYKTFSDLAINSKPALDAAIQVLSAGGATDVVVDLRYNGGGYVGSAAYFSNLLMPASANGKVMFVEYYNQMMQNRQALLLKNQMVYDGNNHPKNYTYYDIDYSVAGNTQLVSKAGSFNNSSNISSIYFIVSSSTASASEMLINSLKPYYANVYLIGASFSDDGKYTYGKPIGFFEIRLGKYSCYMSNFETKNANGTGGYYQGMTTDWQAFDDIRYDFGNPNEVCLRTAIRKITGNSNYVPATATVARTVAAATEPASLWRGVAAVGDPVKVKNMYRTAD